MPTFEQHYTPIQLAKLLLTGRKVVLVAVFTLFVEGCGRHSESDQQISVLQKQITLQSQQIEELKTELTEKAKLSSLDQQSKCADRAHKDFEDWGYINKQNADFVSHYNAALGRCFIQTQNTLADFFYRELFDAYSGKQYGEYGWEEKPDKKYREVRPFLCDVTPPSGEKRVCESEDDFQKLAAVYMED